MEKNQMQINVNKELFLIPAYKALNGSCRLMLFEMAVYGGSGDLAIFSSARCRKDDQSLAILVQNGLVEVEGGKFKLTAEFIKQDNALERVRKSRAAKKQMLIEGQEMITLNSPQNLCPYKEIVDTYNEILGGELRMVKDITEDRKRLMKARWFSIFKSNKVSSKDAGIKYFRWYFEQVSQNEFFMRRTDKHKTKGHENWKASFDWLMTDKPFIQVYEEAATEREKHA